MVKTTGINQAHNEPTRQNLNFGCSGKECVKLGTRYLTIIFLKKSGWFCADCAAFLESNELLHNESKLHEHESIQYPKDMSQAAPH